MKRVIKYTIAMSALVLIDVIAENPMPYPFAVITAAMVASIAQSFIHKIEKS